MTASRLRTFVLVAAALMAGTVVRAQQPQQTSKSATAAAPSSPQAAASPGQKAAATDGKAAGQALETASAETAVDPSAQLLKDAANAGFRPEHIRGTLMFCRTATELGSNFPVRTCYNEQQTKIKIQEYQAQRNQLRQAHSLFPQACRPPNC